MKVRNSSGSPAVVHGKTSDDAHLPLIVAENSWPVVRVRFGGDLRVPTARFGDGLRMPPNAQK